jgi:photosystem II stability/assembly factor-like uncharacterized protein
MAERDQDFDLARLDQQIAHPSGFLDAPARRLVEDLQQMYQTPPADQQANAESLQRVQRRLGASLASRHRETRVVPPGASQGYEERNLSMKKETSERVPRPRRLSRTLSVFAAATLLVALVGGLVAGLVLVHHGGPKTGTALTPTATPTATPTPTPITGLSFSNIEMKDASNGWALAYRQYAPVASFTHILHTSDGGVHWKDVTPQAPASAALAGSASFHPLMSSAGSLDSEDFLTGSVAWALREPNQLFITTNGGQTWQSETTPADQIQVTFLDALHGWVITQDSGKVTSTVFRTSDGGATWTRMQQSGSAFSPGSSFLGLRFATATTGWTTCLCSSTAPNGRPTYIAVTHDSGATWQPLHLIQPPGGDTPTYNLPLFFTTQEGVLIGTYTPSNSSMLRGQINRQPAIGMPSTAVIYVTHDGGMTWAGPYTQNLLGLGSPDFIDTQHGWVVQFSSSSSNTSNFTLLTTSDSGQHWTTVPTSANFTNNFSPGSVLSFVSSQIGWAVGYGGSALLKTNDGGHTWTQVNATISN